jgi:hypothetical protein
VYASITVESDLHHDAGVRNTTILPAMTLAEAIETTRIHRVAGLTGVPCKIDAVRVDMPLEAIFDDLTLEWTLAKFKPASRYTSRNAWSDRPARPQAVRETPLSPRPDSRQHRP